MLVYNTNINYKVAKKTNEIEKDLFYLNDEEKPKKKLLKKGKIQNGKEKDNELFSFDNEIIIGVTKKQEPKKQVKKKKTSKTPSKNNKTKQKIIKNEKINKKKKRIAHIIKYGMLTVLFIIVILCAMFSPLFNVKTIDEEELLNAIKIYLKIK